MFLFYAAFTLVSNTTVTIELPVAAKELRESGVPTLELRSFAS